MNTPSFQPGGSRYLVLPEPIGQESETIGGITLSVPKDPNKQAIEGTVVAKGKSCADYELGDKVAFGRFSGYDLKLDGVEYKVFQENELFGKVLVTPFDKECNCISCSNGETVHRAPCTLSEQQDRAQLPLEREECYMCTKPSVETYHLCEDHKNVF